MDILLCTSDEALAGPLVSSLRDAGHVVARWRPGEPVPREDVLLLIDGLDDVVEAHDVPCDVLALVDESELSLFAECPREISDFCVKPAGAPEVLARVRAIAARPPWRTRVQQRLLSVAVESAGDVIEITSPDLAIEYVNPAYEKVLGFGAAEVTGQRPAHLNQAAREVVDEIEATLARGERWTGVIVSRSKGGRLVHLEATISTVTSAKGEVTHRVAVKRDITERIAREEALVQANRALGEARDVALRASRAKSEFLANMSHELRTPLNAIIGYSEILLEDFTEGQVGEDLVQIRNAGSQLLALINDVLDIAKIEAEKVELLPEWFEVRELLAEVASTAQPLAQKNANRVSIEAAPEADRLCTDRTRLRQVLLNLVSNAVKFTEKGDVTLRASSFARDGAPWIELSVQDTGIGIAPEQQRDLFQPFVQADASTTRKYGGTGLGLAICKRLVEMMRGEITLESTPGVGTVMRVTLPRDAGDAEEVERAGPAHAPRVLLIDDDVDVRNLFTRILSKRGFETYVAASGKEGLDAAERLVPDAVVLDVKMPGLDGWEVLSALKLSEATARIPVIMLTVLEQPEIGRALGAADYLLKPFDTRALVASLRRYTRAQQARVLVVEDDAPTRGLVRRTLEGAGSVVFEAENGQIALDLLPEVKPDIVLLDLMMPVMDGFTFLARIRSDARFAELPVVVATARTLDAAERAELERSVLKVIEKSASSREELLETIASEVARLAAR